MRRNTYPYVAAAVAVGLIASACGSSSNSGTSTSGASASAASSTTAAATSTTAAATTKSQSAPAMTPGGSTELPSLIPAPANSEQTKGPDNISDNGIHMYFQVNGSPTDVMNAYKTALEGKGWSLTPIASSGGEGGGGATYTGTHGDAYGVFDGGGFNTTTYIDVCAWASKPANPNCNRGGR